MEIVKLLGFINFRGKYRGKPNVSGFARALANNPQDVRDKLSAVINTIELLESIQEAEPEERTGPGRKPNRAKAVRSTRMIEGKQIFNSTNRIKVCTTAEEWEALKTLCLNAGYFTIANNQRRGSVSGLLENFPREPRKLLVYLQTL